MEPQNVSKIVSDAIKEIQLGDVRKGESVLQLLTQAPNTYHTALQAFRPSLKSEYEDVRSIAACAVGRFGRGVDWVLPALEDGFRQDQDNIMAVCAFAHAIAELKTSDAAQVL